MKTIGQLLVFGGIMAGVDCAALGRTEGMVGAALCVITILLGVVLIRKSKPKS
jgi:hypothetical protein